MLKRLGFAYYFVKKMSFCEMCIKIRDKFNYFLTIRVLKKVNIFAILQLYRKGTKLFSFSLLLVTDKNEIIVCLFFCLFQPRWIVRRGFFNC